jgi:N-acetylmuramic acid 6-phosphate (MurNAc-6-P) etherase
MIRGGKVHGNIMTYVRPSNIKLRNRVKTILEQLLKEANKEKLVQDIPKILEDIYEEIKINKLDIVYECKS